MIYAAVIEYTKDQDKTNAHRPAHRQYLHTLLERGQLVASGPFTDDYGALIIYEAGTEQAAEQLLLADPFHSAGVFVTWTIRPWKPVMANAALLPAGGK